MKLAGLFVLAFLTCCLSFPLEDNPEKDEEMKMLEKLLKDEEIPKPNDPPPATEGDEKSPKKSDQPDEEPEKAEDIPKEADLPVDQTEGDEESPKEEGEEEYPEKEDPPGTEGDEESPDEANPPANGTEGDEEIPEEEAPPATGDEESLDSNPDYPEIPEDEMNLEELLSEDEESFDGDEPPATEGDED